MRQPFLDSQVPQTEEDKYKQKPEKPAEKTQIKIVYFARFVLTLQTIRNGSDEENGDRGAGRV